MKRYVKAILGGLLAVLAAFGWAVASLFLLVWKGVISGVYMSSTHGQLIWIIVVTLIFAVGFYFAFRVAYSRISN
jgi:hypothetical protein